MRRAARPRFLEDRDDPTRRARRPRRRAIRQRDLRRPCSSRRRRAGGDVTTRAAQRGARSSRARAAGPRCQPRIPALDALDDTSSKSQPYLGHEQTERAPSRHRSRREKIVHAAMHTSTPTLSVSRPARTRPRPSLPRSPSAATITRRLPRFRIEWRKRRGRSSWRFPSTPAASLRRLKRSRTLRRRNSTRSGLPSRACARSLARGLGAASTSALSLHVVEIRVDDRRAVQEPESYCAHLYSSSLALLLLGFSFPSPTFASFFPRRSATHAVDRVRLLPRPRGAVLRAELSSTCTPSRRTRVARDGARTADPFVFPFGRGGTRSAA